MLTMVRMLLLLKGELGKGVVPAVEPLAGGAIVPAVGPLAGGALVPAVGPLAWGALVPAVGPRDHVGTVIRHNTSNDGQITPKFQNISQHRLVWWVDRPGQLLRVGEHRHVPF